MDRAEAQKALQACVADEQAYQFTSFSHRDAWELGHALVDACEKMGAPLAVEIEINHVIVFRYYPDGTGAYHEQWLRRKRNLVKHLRSDSTRKKLRDALEKELSAQDSAFQQQVVTGFSRSFKTYLNGIAQAAEIPIE